LEIECFIPKVDSRILGPSFILSGLYKSNFTADITGLYDLTVL